MNTATDYDRRIADWLEEGAQNVPDWLVEAAIQEAHTLPQAGARWRPPWLAWPRPRWASAQALVWLAAGAFGALAVVAAFTLGLLANQVADKPSPSPSGLIESPLPSGGAVERRPLESFEVVNVLPGLDGAFYTLSGLASTGGAVWTVAVYEDAEGSVVNSLVRIDGDSGQASEVSVENAVGLLSPPVAADGFVWTASDAALHRISAGDLSVTDFPLEFDPIELSVGEGGLWVARDGGAALVDPASGAVMREVTVAGAWGDRIIGAPIFGSLWACANDGALLRLDQVTGAVVARIALPAGAHRCDGPVRALSGADGMPDAIVPGSSNVLIDPLINEVTAILETRSPLIEPALIEGEPWFALRLAGEDRQLGLAPLDPATGQLIRVLTLQARAHASASFESPLLLVSAGQLWILADADPGDGGPMRPNVIRVALSQLR